MSGWVIGADVGGTSIRVAVADRSGRVLGRSRGPAGNPNAVGLDASAARIRAAITEALQQIGVSTRRDGAPDGARAGAVTAVVLGMAGFGTALAGGTDFSRAALPRHVAVEPRIVSDLAVAYASATPMSRGSVIIAGTGSSAATIDRGAIVGRRGGWGWLLGDEGAGFWIGREAVRHAATEAERGVPLGALSSAVLTALGIEPDEALAGLLREPYAAAPIRLAELAPLVTRLVDADPAAAVICAAAADQLARLVIDLRPMPGRPVVAAGSVLQTPGPIRSAVNHRLEQQLASPVLDARSGLVGAVWLALAGDRDPVLEPGDPAVHRHLLNQLSSD